MHTGTMPEQRLKRPRDPAQLAKLMIDIASGEVEDKIDHERPHGRHRKLAWRVAARAVANACLRPEGTVSMTRDMGAMTALCSRRLDSDSPHPAAQRPRVRASLMKMAPLARKPDACRLWSGANVGPRGRSHQLALGREPLRPKSRPVF